MSNRNKLLLTLISKHFMFTVNSAEDIKNMANMKFQNISCLRLIKLFQLQKIFDENFKTFHVYG